MLFQQRAIKLLVFACSKGASVRGQRRAASVAAFCEYGATVVSAGARGGVTIGMEHPLVAPNEKQAQF
jgi:hypothetical protein